MRALIIVTVSVVAILGAASAWLSFLDRNYAQPSRELSKMMSVRGTVAPALSAYYGQHTRYPLSLAELPLKSLQWGDEGSSVRDLESWHYSSDGMRFTLTWETKRGTKIHLGGRSGQLFYEEDLRKSVQPDTNARSN